jgi:hypothetical protein
VKFAILVWESYSSFVAVLPVFMTECCINTHSLHSKLESENSVVVLFVRLVVYLMTLFSVGEQDGF